MSNYAISTLRRIDPARSRAKRGAALVTTLVIFMGLFGLAYAAVISTQVEVKDSRRSVDQVRAKLLAESGYERAVGFLRGAVVKNGLGDPLIGLKSLFIDGDTRNLYLGEPVIQGVTQVGAYSVTLQRVAQTLSSIQIEVRSTGYLPLAPGALAAGEALGDWEALAVTVEYSLTPSGVFDYAYFINNWGWFYGNTIEANGNVRSNGQFDVAGYAPKVEGQPIYDSVDWNGTVASLAGYHDDNGDGLEDGNDGGVWSGWDIVGAQNLRGNGGLADNQHDYQESLPMPNLNDLSGYEALAIQEGTSLSIGGVQVSNAVYGDELGESGNLYLVGTLADPIQLDGSIVAQGDVIISGYVTGQGAIYAGGNIYCPESVQYVDGTASPRPADGTQAENEAWLAANWNKDFLGLFAKENIVVGDFTNSTWKHYVGWWMNSSMNKSVEDAGEDGIPNTYAGFDGLQGTADDDVLEGDSIWTVEYYTAEDEALGLIPATASVGDAIPGTGEDIDGDGVYDATTTMADLDLAASLDPNYWGGNMPPGGIANYSDISSLYANHLDAVFYTNHSFCHTVLGSQPLVLNGALVSRNENVVYGTPYFKINYDARLLGGSSGVGGALLPRGVGNPKVIGWEVLNRDPNRYLVEVQP